MAWDWMPHSTGWSPSDAGLIPDYGERHESGERHPDEALPGSHPDKLQAPPPSPAAPPPASNEESLFAKAFSDPIAMAKQMFFNPDAVKEISREGAPAAQQVVQAAMPAAKAAAQAAQPAVQEVMAEADKARAASLWQSIPVTAKLAAGAAVVILVGRKLIKLKR